MDAKHILLKEHRLIERVLDCTERMCNAAIRDMKLDGDSARRTVAFLREFADRCHHLKEEEVLFPAIEQRDFFPGCGLMEEHARGRKRAVEMADAIAEAESGSAEAVRRFVRNARSYCEMLRTHIIKEDTCLIETLERIFSPEEMEDLGVACQRLESEQLGAGQYERFEKTAEELESRYPAES